MYVNSDSESDWLGQSVASSASWYDVSNRFIIYKTVMNI